MSTARSLENRSVSTVQDSGAVLHICQSISTNNLLQAYIGLCMMQTQRTLQFSSKVLRKGWTSLRMPKDIVCCADEFRLEGRSFGVKSGEDQERWDRQTGWES